VEKLFIKGLAQPKKPDYPQLSTTYPQSGG
jgi:hypothetical protein